MMDFARVDEDDQHRVSNAALTVPDTTEGTSIRFARLFVFPGAPDDPTIFLGGRADSTAGFLTRVDVADPSDIYVVDTLRLTPPGVAGDAAAAALVPGTGYLVVVGSQLDPDPAGGFVTHSYLWVLAGTAVPPLLVLLNTINLSDPALGPLAAQGAARGLAVDERFHLYVATEVPGAPPRGELLVLSFDSFSATATPLSSLPLPDRAIDVDIDAPSGRGPFLYVADDRAGLVVVDAANPALPTIIGGARFPPTP
jgi:hypothetical protein